MLECSIILLITGQLHANLPAAIVQMYYWYDVSPKDIAIKSIIYSCKWLC